MFDLPGGSRVRTWNDRFFEGVPIAPGWVGAVLAGVLLAGLLAAAGLSGELAEFVRADVHWWSDRNARLALLLALLAGYLPVARRYESLRAARCMVELQESGLSDRSTPGLPQVRTSRAGGLGLLAVPLTALLVDRDPSLYLQTGYWQVSNLFNWFVGAATTWNLGALLAAVHAHARHFSELARESDSFALLRLQIFRPFARYGLGCVLLWSIALALWALNLIDRGFAASVALTAAVAVAGATVALWLPLRGARSRIRTEKERELRRIDRTLAGDSDALAGSAVRFWPSPLGLADLLAYRSFVEGLREWPLDAPTLTRFVLYVGIPVGSWLGGALVERVVDAILSP
jgi:hypothetical protein